MVKQQKHNNRKSRTGKAFSANRARARKINASTRFETCSEQLSPFGGLLALIKFFDLVGFREIFHFAYQSPSRQPKLGHYSMMTGKLRKGATVTGQETAAFIADIKKQLPGCVQEVLLRADGEFLSWESVQAAIEAGFDFIIANRGCTPVFDPNSWYRSWKRKAIEFNSCLYQHLALP